MSGVVVKEMWKSVIDKNLLTWLLEQISAFVCAGGGVMGAAGSLAALSALRNEKMKWHLWLIC